MTKELRGIYGDKFSEEQILKTCHLVMNHYDKEILIESSGGTEGGTDLVSLLAVAKEILNSK